MPKTQSLVTLLTIRFGVLLASLILASTTGCGLLTQPTPTETQIPIPTPTSTPVDTLTPSRTMTPTARPTITPTPSNTPTITLTPTPSPSPYPVTPPQPTVISLGDNVTHFTIDKQVTDGIGKTWLSFTYVKSKSAVAVTGTPAAEDEKMIVYLVSPGGGSLIKVVELPATIEQRLYWSPDGAYLAYFLDSGSASGLYVLDLQGGFSVRLFNLSNLSPRGILSEPVWSSDSKQLTISLATPYDVDIFSIAPDGSGFKNLTNNPAFDFWPAWSPDGQYLAFVSDRGQCSTWVPNAPGSCYKPDAPVPDGGNLYILEKNTGEVRKIADSWVNAPPHWISSTRLAFTSGTPGDPLAGSALWWVDLRGGAPFRVTGEPTPGLRIVGDTWSNDGKHVVYQEATSETFVVLRDEAGNEIARSSGLNFPRIAFSAAWSPDGKRLIIGGHNSQCPYGILMTDDTFKQLIKADPSPGVCDPLWSADGRYVAFTGFMPSTSSTDGRIDLYVVEASGVGARNLSGRLGGKIQVLGWVGQ